MPENWYKSRGYLHFDRPINQAAALEIVSSPKTVAKHTFYPFIRYVAQTQKVFFDKALGKWSKKTLSSGLFPTPHTSTAIFIRTTATC